MEETNNKPKRSDALKLAQKKYRDKNKAIYNASQNALYHRQMLNDEWRLNRNAKCKVNMQRYYDKLRNEAVTDEPIETN